MKKTVLFYGLIVTAILIGACGRQAGEEVKIAATSVHGSFGPDGLLKTVEPGWRAKTPPTSPQIVTFTFMQAQQIHQMGLLPQAGQLNRAPKRLAVEISDDASTWKEVAAVER
jgi:hypothetical protein